MTDLKHGATLRVGIPFLEPVTPYVEPATAFTPIGWNLTYNLYERLVELERDWQGRFRVVPSLAESWTVAPDYTVYSFKLRPDVRFASGRPVTPDDVRFSLERHIQYGDPPARFLPLQEVRVAEDGRIDVVLREPSVIALTILSTPLGSIVDQSVIPLGDDLGHGWLSGHSAGSAAFAMEQIAETKVVLKANSDHWRDAPALDRVIIQDGPDTGAQRQALERGELDLSMGIAPADFRELVENPQFVGARVPALGVPHVSILKDTTGPDGRPLALNTKLTAAIKYALDYGAVADLYGGWGNGVEPCQSGVIAGIPGYDPFLATYYRPDVERAQRLLAEAGYPNGLELTFSYWDALWGGVPTRRIVEQVRSALARIGIKGPLRNFTGGDYFARPAGSLDGITLSMSAYQVPDPDDVLRRRMTWSGGVSGYRFEATDKFVKAAAEPDPVRRAALYQELQRQFLEEAPMIYLLTFPYNIVWRRDLTGCVCPPSWSGLRYAGIARA